MCQSYIRSCACGQKEAEMMFGHMVFDESVVRGLYCPECASTVDLDKETMVGDNGWILELDGEILKAFAPRMRVEYEEATAERTFDDGFVTWVGMTPEDNRTRGKERQMVMDRFANDKREQFEALKRWAIAREKQFVAEGWRKAVRK